MEGKRYSLRSGGSNTCPRQAKLEFPCRRSSSRSAVKRRPRPPSMDDRGAKPGTAVDENESPPKRSRVTGMYYSYTQRRGETSIWSLACVIGEIEHLTMGWSA